jgi:hypothetical protein
MTASLAARSALYVTTGGLPSKLTKTSGTVRCKLKNSEKKDALNYNTEILEVLTMESKNATKARFENDQDYFIRMTSSSAQQRIRNARRKKDADQERFDKALGTIAACAATFAIALLIFCLVF